MPITQVIPEITDIPDRINDTPAVFSSKVLASLNQQNAMRTALNTYAGQVNALLTDLNSLEGFSDIYYGALASDPTLNPSGNPIQAGDEYFNTTIGRIKVYTGSVWTEASALSSDYYTITEIIANYYNKTETYAKTETYSRVEADSLLSGKVDEDLSTLTEKTTPVDADLLALGDSASTFSLKKFTFANLLVWLKGFMFGWDQTWQDVTASRSAGVTYTNTTGKPIQVVFTCITGTGSVYGYINGIEFILGSGSGTYFNASTMYIIVPNGSTYKVSSFGSGSQKWLELR